MNILPGVTTAANLSLFRGNGADHLRADGHPRDPAYSGMDLKADWRGYKYVEETVQMFPEKPAPILWAKLLNQVAGLGRSCFATCLQLWAISQGIADTTSDK